MIGVRVTPEFRAEIAGEAEKRFGGNESLLMREATALYIRMRHKLGPQFEPTINLLIGESVDEKAA
jgi:hypothetical protein